MCLRAMPIGHGQRDGPAINALESRGLPDTPPTNPLPCTVTGHHPDCNGRERAEELWPSPLQVPLDLRASTSKDDVMHAFVAAGRSARVLNALAVNILEYVSKPF